MIDILNWFDTRDHFWGLIIVMCVFFWGVCGIATALRGGKE